jgi:hypothetical protein
MASFMISCDLVVTWLAVACAERPMAPLPPRIATARRDFTRPPSAAHQAPRQDTNHRAQREACCN